MEGSWDIDENDVSVDCLFEGSLVVVIPATVRAIRIAPDGVFEVRLTPDVLKNVMDGDDLSDASSPAGNAIRQLLAV